MKENEIELAIEEIEKEISSLPKGYLTTKTIYGKKKNYLQWSENKKKKCKYLNPSIFLETKEKVERRKKLEEEAKSLIALLPGGKRKEIDNPSFDLSSNVLVGTRLRFFLLATKGYKKREIFATLRDYLDKPSDGKVLVLYGLRRTGKSTLIRQAIGEMEEADFNRAAFIQVSPSMTLSSLFDEIKALQKLNYRYVFVDEVTLLSDFIEGAAFFSDVFACSDMKIVLSGTDSLGFLFASSSSLFDRAILLHTTFIPYREFESILGIKGIDNYISYGGTLCLGEDHRSPFFEDERVREEYLDSAIANNIQHSLKNYQDGTHFRDLQELYEKHELTSLINRVVEDGSHRFALDVLNEDFFSHDLGISSRNLRKEKEDFYHILDKIDRKKVEETEKRLLDIKDAAEREVNLEEAHIEEIKEYLEALDLTSEIELRSVFPSSKKRTKTLFTLPGLRYAQAKALVSSLLKEEAFASLSLSEKNLVLSRILNEIKGRMMEEIVLLETKLAFPGKEVFKLEFLIGEFDMVISDEKAERCEIYEIKHSEEIVEEQYRHLIDEEKLEKTRFRYGEISKRVVLYRGESKTLPNGIVYMNVEEYLKSLGKEASSNLR